MSDSKTIVSLNLGSQKISMAVFDVSKSGGLILKGYDSDSHVYDPSVEINRDLKLKAIIVDLAKKLKVSKSSIRYAISGQSAFTRFVKLPMLQAENIEQLVMFEAQQNVPYSINEVIWDYEMMENPSEKEVVIVAVKSDSLNEINTTITESGLTPLEVDVAPLALYNAYRFSYGVSDESTLIIDIGSKTTNLLYVEGTRFFTRSISIGGASITSAIAKEYSVSFADAEHHKIANGMIALNGEHAESMEDSVGALSMVISNSLARLPSEISRTTNYYRSQQGGNPPKKVLLAGGGSNLPFTLELLQEKLGLPIEFFNPLSKVTIDKSIDIQKLQTEAHMMGELVGLALRGISKAALNIDLVPSAIEEFRAEKKRRPYFLSAAVLLIVGFGINAAFQALSLQKAQDRNRTLTETREQITPVEIEMRKLLEAEKSSSHTAETYIKLDDQHAQWFQILDELTGTFSHQSLWITELMPLYNYEPVSLTKSDKSKSVLFPVIKSDYLSSSNNDSSLMSPPSKDDASRNKPMNQRSIGVQKDLSPVANAIYLKGFWRDNPRSQNVVSDRLKQLREISKVFHFKYKSATGQEVELSDEQLIKRLSNTKEQEGDLAYAFEIILPLSRSLAIK